LFSFPDEEVDVETLTETAPETVLADTQERQIQIVNTFSELTASLKAKSK